MASKNKPQGTKQQTSRVSDDPTVIAYRFVRTWKKRNGQEIVGSSGRPIRSLSKIYRGKGAPEGCTVQYVQDGLADDTLVSFLSDSIEVIKASTREARSTVTPF